MGERVGEYHSNEVLNHAILASWDAALRSLATFSSSMNKALRTYGGGNHIPQNGTAASAIIAADGTKTASCCICAILYMGTCGVTRRGQLFLLVPFRLAMVWRISPSIRLKHCTMSSSLYRVPLYVSLCSATSHLPSPLSHVVHHGLAQAGGRGTIQEGHLGAVRLLQETIGRAKIDFF